ncbi:MAG: hypothetical protein JW724_00150 [Candidatus Altiarchaeota archaeon]|nr:hypothetical protein [Candidatus Altiarchaeota archaeon]
MNKKQHIFLAGLILPALISAPAVNALGVTFKSPIFYKGIKPNVNTWTQRTNTGQITSSYSQQNTILWYTLTRGNYQCVLHSKTNGWNIKTLGVGSQYYDSVSRQRVCYINGVKYKLNRVASTRNALIV